MPRRGPCATERRPVPPRGGPLCREVFCAERIGGGPCVGRLAHYAEWSYSSMLRGLREAPVSGGGSFAERRLSVLVGPVLCAERIEGGPYAEKRPLCRREEAAVPPRGGRCAERRPSVPEGLLC